MQQARATHIQRPKLKKITVLAAFALWQDRGSVPLPGFDAAGARVAGAWHAATNEPIRKTVKAWVAFIKDLKNYHDSAPFVAGVPGAPDLASFEVRIAGAPAKP